jgi:hypothetical protein
MAENTYYVVPRGKKSITIPAPEGAHNTVHLYPGDWVVTNGNTVGKYNRDQKKWELLRHDADHAMKWSDDVGKQIKGLGGKEVKFNNLAAVEDKLPKPPNDGLGVYLHVQSQKYQAPNKTWDPKSDTYTMKDPPPKAEDKPKPDVSDDSMDEHIKGFRKQRLSPAEMTLKLRKLDEKKKWSIGDVEKRIKSIDAKEPKAEKPKKETPKDLVHIPDPMKGFRKTPKPKPGEGKADFLREVGDQMVANPNADNRKLHPQVKVKSLPWEDQKKFYDSWRKKSAYTVVTRYLARNSD